MAKYGSITLHAHSECTTLTTGLIHMPRNYVGIKYPLALKNDSRSFSVVEFYLKIVLIYINLHLKCKSQGFPMENRRRAEGSQLPPLSLKWRPLWPLEWKTSKEVHIGSPMHTM